jgi:hypothetical protein
MNLPLVLFVLFWWIAYARGMALVSVWKAALYNEWSATVAYFSGASVDDTGLSCVIEPGSAHGKVAMSTVPGDTGLPFVGDTLALLANPTTFFEERREQFGDLFVASIDFTGTFLAARPIVCVYHSGLVSMEAAPMDRPSLSLIPSDSPNFKPGQKVDTPGGRSGRSSPRSERRGHKATPQSRGSRKGQNKTNSRKSQQPHTQLPPLQHPTEHSMHNHVPLPTQRITRKLVTVGYSGLYGSSCHGGELRSHYVPALAERLLGEYKYLDYWEDVVTPVVQSFLRRLVYEGGGLFSFADRVNE